MHKEHGKFLFLTFLVLFLVCVVSRAPAAKKKKTFHGKSRAAIVARARRMARVFHASSDLRPMAQLLLVSRTPAAYAGVQRYAQAHINTSVGALAWFAIGYARTLDHQYALAIPALKKAKPRIGELSDYVDYFLASAQQASGASQEAAVTLSDFDKHYPDSILSRDACVIAANALLAQGQVEAAIALLHAHRAPYRADIELVLGRAEARAGNISEALEALRRVYFTMLVTPEAEVAKAELQSLATQKLISPPTMAERKERAELLVQQHRASDAVQEYKSLVEEVPSAEQPALNVALAGALWHSGKDDEARHLLEKLPDTDDELNAQRIYYLIEVSRSDEQKIADLITRLRATAPESPWFQESLLAIANIYLLKNDYATSQRFFAELAERFPEGKHGSYASWKSAWLLLRQGDVAAAKPAFEEHIAHYPGSQETPNALYWRGRLAEEEKDSALARTYYQKISERYRHSYYAELSREQLRDLSESGGAADLQLLDKIPPSPHAAHFLLASPVDDLQAQKSLLLENSGMVDFAVRELQSAHVDGDSDWRVAQIAKLYSENGRYINAIEALKRATPAYYSFEIAELPRPLWEELFPRPYWSDLKRYAAANQLDPFLVASLIRQESEFNATAISSANAVGLMQLLPKVGKQLAKSARIKHYNPSMLVDPTINLQLGTLYFKQLLNKYDGQIEYALAAYNAGSDRVDDWRKNKYRDVHEFVESIPFTETRQYVEAILRNVDIYQLLYPTGAGLNTKRAQAAGKRYRKEKIQLTRISPLVTRKPETRN